MVRTQRALTRLPRDVDLMWPMAVTSPQKEHRASRTFNQLILKPMNTGKHIAMVLLQSLLATFIFVGTLLAVATAIMYLVL